MPERDGYIPGVPCWVDASQPDLEAATAFYAGLFGWEFRDVLPAESEDGYLVASCETSAWSLFDQSGGARSGNVAALRPTGEAAQRATWNTYFWVDSADEAASRVRDSGGQVVVEPFDFMDAGRVAVCRDPEGVEFSLWEAQRHKGATLVNDPGSLNFNGLATRDVEAARSFYGAVFGWGTLVMDGGLELWTLPGYGDYLEGYHPGLRDQMAAAGAPPRFEDVVATINPLEDDTPAHWSVTFATDDADAAAAKAVELGGQVLVPPFDAPWVRMTVLADPQGAAFVASRFTPENRRLG